MVYADFLRNAIWGILMVSERLGLNYIKRGVQPPKWYDVSDVIEGYLDIFPEKIQQDLKVLTKGAKWLRSQREVAFYGGMDLIPEDLYTKEDAIRAINLAGKYLEITKEIFE